MKPIVPMADAESAIIAYLKAHLSDDVAVGRRVPNPRPDKFVQVRRFGGRTDSVVLDKPRIDCLVFLDADAGQRMDLAQEVHALLLAIQNDEAGGALLYSASDFLAPIQAPDPIDADNTVGLLTVEVVIRKAAQA